MNYNPDKQYRCTIIRGKSISRMDDYLSVYANILNDICPISTRLFKDAFDRKLARYIKNQGKTIRNHRTENADKLLGMYYEKDGITYLSERTIKFMADTDQPAFFKSVCYRFQQPNGSQKTPTIIDKLNNRVAIKPYHFVLSLLKLASTNDIILTKNEVAYYVLNALQVLQGRVSVNEVFDKIIVDRHRGGAKRVKNGNKAYSYYMKHINEQFDYLELANLIRKDNVSIWLNSRESAAINLFVKDLSNPLSIDYTKYNLEEKGIGKVIENEWREYYGRISQKEKKYLRRAY